MSSVLILHTLQGEGRKCSQADAGKYKLMFLFSKIAVFLVINDV